MIQKCPK